MSAAIDVQLPQAHPWSGEYMPSLIGREWWLNVTTPEGGEQSRPARVVGAVRLPPEVGGIVVKLEIP